jgi:hypothetical protein
MDIVAIQRGTADPDRVIVITGHLDSRVTDIMNFTSDAPGANDDASGVAAVMEAARVLSKYKFRATLVYAALSGEEQGLYGGKVLADYARQQGWKVRPTSTTTSSATPMARTACTTTAPCACSPKAPRRWRRRSRRTSGATTAASSIRRRATSRATWRAGRAPPHQPSACRWSTAPTVMAAAATRWRFSKPASRRCASPKRTRTTPASTRTCARRTAFATATRSTASTSPTSPR